MTAKVYKFKPRAHARERFDPSLRGYQAVFRPGQTNHCPGCGRMNWYVGRLLAECAFCTCAVEIEGVRR